MPHMLFNPGPTNVSDDVKNSLITENLCHRDEKFSVVLKRICENLVFLFDGKGSHSCIPFVCSGTGANEAILGSIQGKILIIENGKYSQRIVDIAERLGLSYKVLHFDDLEVVGTKKIEESLKADPEIRHIFLVHHETTTSLLVPLREIGQLAKQYNVLLSVDAISSAAGHMFSLKEDNIAFCTISANKCLESVPGVAFVLARTDEIKKLKGKSKSYYFDLFNQWENLLKGRTPFTAAVQVFFAVDKAIQVLMQEGVDARVLRYQTLLKHLKQGLKKMGINFVELPESSTSNILTLMYMPEGVDYQELYEKMFERGYTIYTDKESLSKGRFFLSTMGQLTLSDVDLFLENLKEVLLSIGYKPSIRIEE